eukprot:TRINITY_DN5212_c0_g1_i2.p1 TRINITY_DN5212_c0_g1~~TRINITY_DN5212_c0_g1_i2.p1  ORF type:complete len:656 (+),score=135.69 TRINITY_DN5212_c0_g1_i2:31-1998(+)
MAGPGFCICTALLVLASSTVWADDIHCDIVIAGGSTASLAAAITAAEADTSLTVCFTEITDWPGGQMTSGGVPAIDFGGENSHVENQPASFRDFFNHLDGNPGGCTVSIKCYLPNKLVETWINPRLARSPNLKVFLRTAVVDTSRAPNGDVTSIDVVQRTPRDNYTEYSQRFSDIFQDWYSPDDSAYFTKELHTLHGRVFVEATEFGDMLVSGDFDYAQGIEIPDETSTLLDSTCGQVWTTTFYMSLAEQAPANPTPVPAGDAGGLPFSPTQSAEAWHHGWEWRRSWCNGDRDTECGFNNTNVGDVTQQNLGNDLDTAYILLPIQDVKAQRPWKGGLDPAALRMLEDRAYAYFHWMNTTAPNADWSQRIVLNYTTAGTGHGLSKMPYLRDTRRAIGLDGFRLTYDKNMNYYNESSPYTGYRFYDTIALGNYNDDVHHLKICTYPDYMLDHTTKPYYIPFRALTVQNSSNFLVAGKTMAQTFHANGATRLHPSEWTSGVAAGGTAVLMLRNNWTTKDALDNIASVKQYLNSSAIGQPLEWRIVDPNHAQIGYQCATSIGRCVGVDKNVTHTAVYPNNTCHDECRGLADNEWLALDQFWSLVPGTDYIQPIEPSTLLKKSIANSQVLPASEVKSVDEQTKAKLVTSTKFEGYYLCSL